MGQVELYHEYEAYGNGYRKTYQEGLECLLKTLEIASEEKRKSYHTQICETPNEFRSRIRKTLGWPLTVEQRKYYGVRRHLVAQDILADIYRVQLEVHHNVWAYGILFLQHSNEPKPLVIAQHGGLGTPEMVSGFFDYENYNDMTRRILRKGAHVFCPQLFIWDQPRFGSGRYDHLSIDHGLKYHGSSLAAVELDGLQKWIDYLQTLPEVLSEKIGMIGMSYGGFYTLYTSALDQRIKAAMCSCFFSSVRSPYDDMCDMRWFDSANVFKDTEVIGLICPRKLWLQFGDNDELFRCEWVTKELNQVREFYKVFKENLRVEVFSGVHEFGRDDVGIDFVVEALQ